MSRQHTTWSWNRAVAAGNALASDLGIRLSPSKTPSETCAAWLPAFRKAHARMVTFSLATEVRRDELLERINHFEVLIRAAQRAEAAMASVDAELARA